MLVAALLVLTVVGYSQAVLPAVAPSAVIGGQSPGQCPSQAALASARSILTQNITTIIRDSVLPGLQVHNFSCDCGGTLNRQIAYLNMTDSSQSCPSGWQYLATPVRACTRLDSSTASCSSVFYPSNGVSYRQVCGRIIGYQRGTPNAFQNSITGYFYGIEGQYIDGVSLTHGVPGYRQHVWSFANTYYESLSASSQSCPCLHLSDWQYMLPSFIGNNYFCDTGNHGIAGEAHIFYQDDPLWDGEGCGTDNSCCQFNHPPWFCRTLPAPTSDDLEIRICGDQDTNNENTYISNIEIYVI